MLAGYEGLVSIEAGWFGSHRKKISGKKGRASVTIININAHHFFLWCVFGLVATQKLWGVILSITMLTKKTYHHRPPICILWHIHLVQSIGVGTYNRCLTVGLFWVAKCKVFRYLDNWKIPKFHPPPEITQTHTNIYYLKN